jgi:hypothetical protein
MTAAQDTDAGGLLSARPLAALAHALRAAAAFIEQAGVPGLSLTLDAGQITIQVPADLAGPASRTAAVTLLAAAAGGRAGHDVRIFTAITEEAP